MTEANQAPGPAWKAKLREQVVNAALPYDAKNSVLALIDALPDPPTPDPDGEAPDDLLYRAWGLIANACGGDWDEADRLSDGWKAAAVGWRDAWHATLPGSADPGPTAPTPDPDAPPVYVPSEGHYIVRGEDVRDGWKGRYLNGGGGFFWSANHCRANPTTVFEVRRAPATKPATEWVPWWDVEGKKPAAVDDAHPLWAEPVAGVKKIGGVVALATGVCIWHTWPVRDDGCVEVLTEGERS